MTWHVDPDRYAMDDCTYCTDHHGRPTGFDPEHPGIQCPICHGDKKVSSKAPEPGHYED